MYRLIEKAILARVLFVAWFFVTASPALLILWLQHDHEEKQLTLSWISGVWVLLCFGGSWWLGKTTAHHMVDEKLMFFDSVKHTWYDLRLRLAFVPLIGTWFTPDEDKTQYDDDDDIRSDRLR